MNFIPYDINKIKNRNSYQYSENRRLLEEFVDSGLECAKIEGYTHKTAFICTSSLNHSIKHYRLNTVKAMTRDGEVFLIKQI